MEIKTWVRHTCRIPFSRVYAVAEDAIHQPLPAREPSVWQVWWRLARPFSLTASIVPVLVGTAVVIAEGGFRSIELFLAMLIASVLIQVATNMFNEYYDYRRGLDTPQTVGIAGAIVSGRVPAIAVFTAAIACFFVALMLGLYIVVRTSPQVLFWGVASALAGYLYTGGPLPVAYTPFGEAVVGFFMGPVIVGLASFIHTGALTSAAMWAAIPIGCLVAAILLANNIRDIVADSRGGRHTIPITLGRDTGIAIYGSLIAGAYISVIAAVILRVLPPTSLLMLLTAPMGPRLVRLYRSTQDPQKLNAGVRGSAALHGRFGLLFALGIAIWPLVARVLPTT
jgi:1,4-dihydroxy-2-naphthoate octaprenyltransferase